MQEGIHRRWALSVAAAMTIAAAAPAEAGWTSHCSSCARHMGGSGTIGPTPTKVMCEAARRRQLAMGNRFGECKGFDDGPATRPSYVGTNPFEALFRPIGQGLACLLGLCPKSAEERARDEAMRRQQAEERRRLEELARIAEERRREQFRSAKARMLGALRDVGPAPAVESRPLAAANLLQARDLSVRAAETARQRFWCANDLLRNAATYASQLRFERAAEEAEVGRKLLGGEPAAVDCSKATPPDPARAGEVPFSTADPDAERRYWKELAALARLQARLYQRARDLYRAYEEERARLQAAEEKRAEIGRKKTVAETRVAELRGKSNPSEPAGTDQALEEARRALQEAAELERDVERDIDTRKEALAKVEEAARRTRDQLHRSQDPKAVPAIEKELSALEQNKP